MKRNWNLTKISVSYIIPLFDSLSPFYTFPDQMPDDTRCKIFVVRGDPASLISNAGVNTVFLRWWHGQWRFLYGWTRYLPVDPRKNPGPCRRDHGAYGLSRSLYGWFTDLRGCPQINKIFLCCVDIPAWSSVTGRVLSGINPWTIRILPCSSIENTRTWMAQVFTRSLRWLHGTSRFIHGTNTIDFRPGRSGKKIKHV
jgi:hypothetical protein